LTESQARRKNLPPYSGFLWTGVVEDAGCYTFRHSFATHLLLDIPSHSIDNGDDCEKKMVLGRL
jgi:integrase